jgi:hypothetical protein
MVHTREYYDLQALLRKEGYTDVADDDTYLENVLCYLDVCEETYTIFDWLNDTKENYPNDLQGYTQKGFVSQSYDEVSKIVDGINDFTDSIKVPRIPMRIGFTTGVCYVVPINNDDIDRFKVAAEYVEVCLWQNS